jgi:predicted O-methyltransferase YrrM
MTDNIIDDCTARTENKWLSVVLVCRNDNYMGNYKYRLATSINYLARNLKQIGRLEEVEILVTDWNSETPIAKVLPLSTDAGEITQFIYVPPTIATKFQQPDQVFHSSCSMNVALRRATGEFLMMVDADTLMPLLSLKAICEFLEGKVSLPLDREKCFFLGNRRHIPWEVVQRELSLEEWDVYLLLNAGELVRDRGWPGLGVCQIAWLAHRSIWHECQGFNQQLHYWGWNDAELTLRITQNYPWINLESLGILLFHMEHWPYNRRTIPSLYNPHTVSVSLAANDANWGLASFPLEIQKGENVDRVKSNQDRIIFWEQPPEQLLAEIGGAPVQQHLETVEQIAPGIAAERTSLELLAWYSLYHYPRTYLEFGISKGNAAVLVAAACPNVTIYGIDAWELKDQTTLSPDDAMGLLKKIDYQGYTRLITGEISTAWNRLQASAIGKLSLDLVLVRWELIDNAEQQLSSLLCHLAPGGLMVITTKNISIDNFVWQHLQEKLPELTYLKINDNTRVIVAASLLERSSGLAFNQGRSQQDSAIMPLNFAETDAWKNFQIEQIKDRIKSMESSKFWKLRTVWLELKRKFNLLFSKSS